MRRKHLFEKIYGRHFSCEQDAFMHHIKNARYLEQLGEHHGNSKLMQIFDKWEAGQTHEQIREWMGLSYSLEYIGSLICAARYYRNLPAYFS